MNWMLVATPFDATFLPLPTKLVIPCKPPPLAKTRRALHQFQKAIIFIHPIYTYDSTPSFCKQSHIDRANGELPPPKIPTPSPYPPCSRLVAKTSAACIFRYTKFPTRIDKPYSIESRMERVDMNLTYLLRSFLAFPSRQSH